MSEASIDWIAEIRAADELLTGVVVRTPMEESRWLSGLTGGEVQLKCENLQRTGSFKARGAYVRIARLSDEEKARGVVAASAGNHAQGVALAAQMLGINATVFMPHGAPIPKEKATRAYGAEVIFAGRYLEDALAAAREFAEHTGAILIHPFDHVDVVAGQGTAGLEIVEQAPHASTVLVPTGGGGLLAGIALAVAALRPDMRVIGVQAEGAAAFPGSLAAGHPVPLPEMTTIADGIAVGLPGQITFPQVRDHVGEIITVSEESISRALLALLERAKMVVEPAGAVAVAAIMDHPERFADSTVAVLSGGNIDPLLLSKVIRHGLAAAGRFVALNVVISDGPGGLAALLQRIADDGASVLEVSHLRTTPSLGLQEVAVQVTLETRSEEHAHGLLEHLRGDGYRVREV